MPAITMTISTFIFEKQTALTFLCLITEESWKTSNTEEYFMYCLWTGKPCIFITVINFPDNNRHTTVFHEKAYFSTIMEYFLQDIIAPRMSSHCYKKYAAFLPRKWLKTAYFCIEDVI